MLRSPSPFGQKVRDRRVALGLTLRDLAVAMGVSSVYVWDVEMGRRGIAHDRAAALAAALRVSARTLGRWAGPCSKCGGTGRAA